MGHRFATPVGILVWPVERYFLLFYFSSKTDIPNIRKNAITFVIAYKNVCYRTVRGPVKLENQCNHTKRILHFCYFIDTLIFQQIEQYF